jgi:glycosyltransferase involved in cell wall biosynthesis
VTPRTVLHVIPTLNVGGAEKQLALLVRGLDRERFRPLVACTTRGGALLEEIQGSGVPVRIFGKKRRLDALLVLRLAGWMRRERPALVHTWMFTANTWGRLAALVARAPALVASERCVDLWKGPLHRALDRLLAVPTRRILANSEAVARFLSQRERIPAGRIRVIPNGLDPRDAERLQPRSPEAVAALRRPLDIPPGAVVVGDVSRIDAKNDLLAWAAVVERLASRHPSLVAVLAGDAILDAERVYARRLREEIRRLGLEGRVRLLGWRRDLENVLPVFDLFLHTSATEGCPNSILEAMAAGIPVVATAAGGTPEVVTDGETGYVAPVGDVAALAERASALLADPGMRLRMGQAGARRARERFSARAMVEATAAIYEEVMREAARSGAGAGPEGAR